MTRASPGAMEAYAENLPHGATPDAMRNLYKGQSSLAGGAKLKDRIQFAFGAQFVEVRVHARTREIRPPAQWAPMPPGGSSIPRRPRAS